MCHGSRWFMINILHYVIGFADSLAWHFHLHPSIYCTAAGDEALHTLWSQVGSWADKYSTTPGTSLWICSGHDRPGNTPGADPGHTAGTTSPSWSESTLGFPPVVGNCFGNDVWAALLTLFFFFFLATVTYNKYSTWIIKWKNKSLTTDCRVYDYTVRVRILTLVCTFVAEYQ